MADQLLKGLTKGQIGGKPIIGADGKETGEDDGVDDGVISIPVDETHQGGRRRRRNSKHHKGNSWLAHVKATMKDKKNKGKSFKQVLKLAKKTYKKSQSLSGGKGKRKTRGMYGGSGHATSSTFGSTAGSYPA